MAFWVLASRIRDAHSWMTSRMFTVSRRHAGIHHRGVLPLLDVRGQEVGPLPREITVWTQARARAMWMLCERKKLRIAVTWEDTTRMVASKQNMCKHSSQAAEEQEIELQSSARMESCTQTLYHATDQCFFVELQAPGVRPKWMDIERRRECIY